MDLDRNKPSVIRMLGEFQFYHADTKVKFPTRKTTSLFGLLVLNHGRRLSRERLTGTLWPDLEEDRARRNLSTALWRLNGAIHSVPGLVVEVDRDFVALHLRNAQVDVFDFLQAVESADEVEGDARLNVLQEAERLYSGDLLEGFRDEWCEDERRVIRSAQTALVRKLAIFFKERSDYTRSVAYLEKLLNFDPYDESSHRELMLAHYLSGNRNGALAHYTHLKCLLLSDLGVSPAQATAELYEHIRVQTEWVLPNSPLVSRSSSEMSSLKHFEKLPLVGREKELTAIIEGLEKARRGIGGAMIVHGDAGIGKTKLVEAVLSEAKVRNVSVLCAKCPDLESAAPYQVLIQAIWPRVSERLLPSSLWSSVINALVEAISADRPRQAGPEDGPAIVDRALLNECILSAFTGPRDSAATLLVLEDLHRVDSASESFLVSLLGRLSNMKLYVLVTLRQGEASGDAVLSSLCSNAADSMLLRPLAEGEIGRLVIAAVGGDAAQERLTRFVWDCSTGVPLFALELLKFLLSERCIVRDQKGILVLDEAQLRLRASTLPSGAGEVIHSRIRLLDAQARDLLLVAAVLGMEPTYAQLEQLIGIPEDEFIESVERLVAARLLEETEKGLRFPHEIIRQTARELMSKARLRRLHARAAAVLEKTMPGKTSDLAWHFLEAGDIRKAVAYFEIAGDKAKTVCASDDAVRWYTRALGIVEGLEQTEPEVLRKKASLLLKRQDALDLAGNRELQAKDVEDLHSIAAKLGDYHLQAQSAFLRSQVLTRLNKSHEALDAAEEAQGLFTVAKDRLGAARAVEVTGLVYVNLRDHARARVSLTRALSLFRRLGDRAGTARALALLGTVTAFSGETTRAIDYIERAEKILRELPDKRALATALLQKGVLYRYVGENEKSRRFLLNGIASMQQIGDRIGQARGLSQVACTNASLGRFREALHESLKAIRVAQDAKDLRALIMFLNNVAYSVYRCLGDWRRAERSILAALEIVMKSRQVENPAIYYDTMAAILIDKGDPEAALDWLKRGRDSLRKAGGCPAFVSTAITFSFAIAYLSLGQFAKAHPLLLDCIAKWREGGDLALQAHAIGALGILKLKTGNLEGALICARDLEGLLRRVDGIEQIQKLHWYQYQIFRAVGANGASRKALRKAVSSLSEQASLLKGRFRRRFLTAVQVNRQIMAEATRLHLTTLSPNWTSFSSDQSNLSVMNDLPPLQNGQRHMIEARRKALARIMMNGRMRQKEVAAQLGVSVRTVRNDLTALRNQGLQTEAR